MSGVSFEYKERLDVYENFVADKWSMANRAPTPEEMISSERKNRSKLSKKKLGLGGF